MRDVPDPALQPIRESRKGSPLVPVTVGILTYQSSIATVGQTLESICGFAEIIVCDGGSSDGTRQLAASFGAKIIDQSPEFVDSEGRLINESGVNEQILEAASNDWVFFLDHDEIATPELVDEIRATVRRTDCVGAYDIPRLYTVDGKVIECASMYPTLQTRLVNRNAIEGYSGVIHAPVVMKPGEVVGKLQEHQLVPMPLLRELWPKWRGYMRLEAVQTAGLSGAEWRNEVLRPRLKLIKRISWKVVKIRRERTGRAMPLRYEVGRIAYECGVILQTGRRFIGLRQTAPDEVWR